MPGLLKQASPALSSLRPSTRDTPRTREASLPPVTALPPHPLSKCFGEGKNKLLLERIKHNFDERFGLCSYISWHLSEEQC